MLVGEQMSSPVITVHPETSMDEALELMHKEHIRRLPVVNESGQLIGIVSEGQLLKASPSDATTLSVWEVRALTRKITIEKIMTQEVTTVTEDTPIEEAARIMVDKNIAGLPVMRDDKIIGLITETDLFKIFPAVLGAHEPGVRLTMLLTNIRGKLVELTKAIFDIGGDIVSLVTLLDENAEEAEVTIKVSSVELESLVDAIKPLVKRIVDVRNSPSK